MSFPRHPSQSQLATSPPSFFPLATAWQGSAQHCHYICIPACPKSLSLHFLPLATFPALLKTAATFLSLGYICLLHLPLCPRTLCQCIFNTSTGLWIFFINLWTTSLNILATYFLLLYFQWVILDQHHFCSTHTASAKCCQDTRSHTESWPSLLIKIPQNNWEQFLSRKARACPQAVRWRFWSLPPIVRVQIVSFF